MKSRPTPRLALAETEDDASSRGSSEYDALADLFLDDASLAPSKPRIDKPTTPAMPSTPRAIEAVGEQQIEGVIVGHLPVLGAAWITQFARLRASQGEKPVALVRLMDGVLSIDLVAEPTLNLDGVPECADLDDALRAAWRFTRHWVVRVGEVAEPDLAHSEQLSSLTLLTGADEAAMVASYRTFKSLWPAQSTDTSAPMPGLRVAIFGADGAKAADAESKLRRASHTFLGRDLDAAAVIQRISSCSVATVYRAQSEMDIASLLERISCLRAPAVEARVAERAAPATPPPAPVVAAPIVETKPAAPARSGSLAPLIDGLRAIESRCPYCPEVELATDAEGRLHLIALHDGSNDQPVKELLATASWAVMHEALLSVASPGVHATHDHGPVLHIVSERTQALKRLFDSGVRVHLLVRVGDVAVCRELN